MKKIFKLPAAIFFLLLMCFSQQVKAQLSDAERQDRCQNNKARLAELESQAAIVNAELRKIPEEKEMDDERDKLILVRRLKTSAAYGPEDVATLRRIASQYQFSFVNYQNCLDIPKQYGSMYRECMAKLEKLIAQKIDKGVALRERRTEFLDKKKELEKQMAFHRNNISALGCDNASGGNNLTGTWKCDDGGTYTITQSGGAISWEAASADGGKTFSHTFTGNITGDVIKGHFKDHAPGIVRQEGDLEFKITGKDQLRLLKASVPFGCNIMHTEN